MCGVIGSAQSSGAAAAAGHNAAGDKVTRQQEDLTYSYLSEALGPRQPARLYYAADCSARSVEPLPFPVLDVTKPPKSGPTAKKVRAVFAKVGGVTVTSGPAGIIRITIGTPDKAPLMVRIAYVRFTEEQRWDPLSAINAIMTSKEVVYRMSRQGALWQRPFDDTLNPITKVPKLPATLRDMSVDEALDRIALAFGIEIDYGECGRKGLIYFSVL